MIEKLEDNQIVSLNMLVDYDFSNRPYMSDEFNLNYINVDDYKHKTKKSDKVINVMIGNYTCYVTKNHHNGWLAYIDVTDYPEAQVFDFALIDSILPFHGGCTYSQWTDSIGNKKFDREHYLIGCDWCHGYDWSNWKTITTFDNTVFGVEAVSFDNVLQNLHKVIEMMPEFRLKMTIRGNNI